MKSKEKQNEQANRLTNKRLPSWREFLSVVTTVGQAKGATIS